MTGSQGPAQFHPFTRKGGAFNDTHVRQKLMQWGMLDNMRSLTFRCDKAYHKMNGAELLQDLFNDPNFQDSMSVLQRGGSWASIAGSTVSRVRSKMVPVDLTRMDIFDKLFAASPQIALEDGELVKCFEDVRGGVQIVDMLRDALFNEESENAQLFSAQEQEQLLFRIFQHLVLGGSMNQYEDNLRSYLDVAKSIYKDLVSVRKSTTVQQVEVVSGAYAVDAVDTDGGWELFPSASRNNFCYVVLDPVRHNCRVWYHAAPSFW